jgi:hypothetical protein
MRVLSLIRRQNFILSDLIARESDSRFGRGLVEPVADNKAAAVRQKNRRLELIISGEVIGNKVGTSQ